MTPEEPQVATLPAVQDRETRSGDLRFDPDDLVAGRDTLRRYSTGQAPIVNPGISVPRRVSRSPSPTEIEPDAHSWSSATCTVIWTRVRRACDRVGPDLILSCGDWGDPEQVDESTFAALLDVAPVYTTFGNHDPDGPAGPVAEPRWYAGPAGTGRAARVSGLRLAAIGGIWAKSHAKPHYVTDADVAEVAARIARSGPVDILITHACPVGLADLTPSGRHGGQRCFLEANKTIMPRLHLCGHLHVAQERTLKDGRRSSTSAPRPRARSPSWNSTRNREACWPGWSKSPRREPMASDSSSAIRASASGLW